MVDFNVESIEELVAGDVRATWTTVADDGLPLTETGQFTPAGVDLETEVAEWLEQVKAKREALNAAPKVAPRRAPAVKRTTSTLSQAAVDRIRDRVGQ